MFHPYIKLWSRLFVTTFPISGYPHFTDIIHRRETLPQRTMTALMLVKPTPKLLGMG